jgi:tRNA (cmo5U34)-methyltransferase
MNGQDKVFREEKKAEDFKFGANVVSVFDDMVTRSVPFYLEMQRMMTEIAADYAVPGTNVYDLGCSTGTTLVNLDRVLPEDVNFVGIDDSKEMLIKCKSNFEAAGLKRKYDLELVDLNRGVKLENPSVVVLCLTLQFIRPLYREKLMEEIYSQLNENGCLILIEKVLGEDSMFNRQFIKYYYDYKRRNHYNEMEIAQKREALENVLIPYKLMENRELMLNTGFRYVETFFKWYNFCGMVAVKHTKI